MMMMIGLTTGDVNHGETSPQNLEWVTLIQIDPIFSKNTAQNSPKSHFERKFIFHRPSQTPPLQYANNAGCTSILPNNSVLLATANIEV